MQVVMFSLIAAIVFAYHVLGHFLQHDPREPPTLPSKIPLIGHAIKIVSKQMDYFVELREQFAYSIYSITIPGMPRIHVVNTMKLIGAMQRDTKNLSFSPILLFFALRFLGPSKKERDVVSNNVIGEEGVERYAQDFIKSLHSHTAHGDSLEMISGTLIQDIEGSFENLSVQLKMQGTVTTGLMEWLRREMTRATSNAMYGPMNPLKDEKVEEALWDFEGNLDVMLTGVLPSKLSPRAYHGREVVREAFQTYFQNNGHEHGPAYIQNQFHLGEKNGLPLAEMLRFHIGLSIGSLTNTIPAAFWMILHMSSDSTALQDCRNEIQAIVNTNTERGGQLVHSLDITDLKSRCPLLLSAFQEVLRHKSTAWSSRIVLRDTLLDGQHLLKKNSVVIAPGPVIHSDPQVWGPDVADFRYKRFLLAPNQKPMAVNLRAFGGGSTMCPGRNIATTEILAVVAILLMGFDVSPTKGSWEAPGTVLSAASAIRKPSADVEVSIRARKDFEDGKWRLTLNSPKEAVIVGGNASLTDEKLYLNR